MRSGRARVGGRKLDVAAAFRPQQHQPADEKLSGKAGRKGGR